MSGASEKVDAAPRPRLKTGSAITLAPATIVMLGYAVGLQLAGGAQSYLRPVRISSGVPITSLSASKSSICGRHGWVVRCVCRLA